MDTSNGLMTRKEAAEFLGIAAGTLANWKSTGFKMIPHLKIGHHVRYRKADLESFLDSCLIDKPGHGTMAL